MATGTQSSGFANAPSKRTYSDAEVAAAEKAQLDAIQGSYGGHASVDKVQDPVTGQWYTKKQYEDMLAARMSGAATGDWYGPGGDPTKTAPMGVAGYGGQGTIMGYPNSNAEDEFGQVWGSAKYDPYAFMLGRDPNYVKDRATYLDQLAGQAAGQYQYYGQGAYDQGMAGSNALMGQAGAMNATGAGALAYGGNMGSALSGMGIQQGTALSDAGQAQGAYLEGAGQSAQNYGLGMSYATAADAAQGAGALGAYGRGSSALGANAANRDIIGPEGPSAAQAQLQSGLNQAQQSSLALARSGRGWGGSASALSAANSQNAAMGQQAVNASAMLRAQEANQYRQAKLQQAGINDQTATNYRAQGLQGIQAGANMSQQGLQNAAQIGMQGYQTGAGIYGQGAGLAQQGIYQGSQLAQDAMYNGSQLGMQGYNAQLAAQQAAGNTMQAGAQMGVDAWGNAAGMYGAGLQAQTGLLNNSSQLWQTQQGIDYQKQQMYANELAAQRGLDLAYSQQQTQLIGAGIGALGGGLGALIP